MLASVAGQGELGPAGAADVVVGARPVEVMTVRCPCESVVMMVAVVEPPAGLVEVKRVGNPFDPVVLITVTTGLALLLEIVEVIVVGSPSLPVVVILVTAGELLYGSVVEPVIVCPALSVVVYTLTRPPEGALGLRQVAGGTVMVS